MLRLIWFYRLFWSEPQPNLHNDQPCQIALPQQQKKRGEREEKEEGEHRGEEISSEGREERFEEEEKGGGCLHGDSRENSEMLRLHGSVLEMTSVCTEMKETLEM